MQIVIVGGGQVGTTLAGKLSTEGHDVSVIESDAARVADLADSLDVRVVAGNGATADSLRSAGAADASLVVAATESDEANFVCGRIAASMFKVPHVVVRLREPDHEEAFRELSRSDAVDIVCVNPEAAAVEEIASLLEVPGALDVSTFMEGELIVAGFPIHEGSEFAERPVLDMRLFFAETPSLVAAIHRGDGALVPDGKETIRTGDIVYFALAQSDLDGMLELLGLSQDASRKVMVAGAGRMGLALAKRLESQTDSLVVIEPDEEHARRASEQLAHAIVVHGPVTSERLLDEEQIERVGTFVALTDDHETNLVAGLLAKRMGAERAFALVDNPALANLIGETTIDAIISPRLLAIGLTLQHIPGAVVHEMAALLGDRVEVLEAEVAKGAPVCGDVIANLDLPRGLLFVAIGRDGELRVPRGADRVEPGDRLLVVAASEHRARLSELLTP
ncbi:MAG: Trk system potassium transporter TrkA [bacterium]|nr:Trk system potassium transporter TrkA [bacterium]